VKDPLHAQQAGIADRVAMLHSRNAYMILFDNVRRRSNVQWPVWPICGPLKTLQLFENAYRGAGSLWATLRQACWPSAAAEAVATDKARAR
jgi:hypothetical protein